MAEEDRNKSRFAHCHNIRKYVTPYPTSLDYFRHTLIFHSFSPRCSAQLEMVKWRCHLRLPESMHLYEDLITLPCYRWTRSLLVPYDHLCIIT